MIFKEPQAIYLQIADRIEEDILNGTYLENERIPSVREYAATIEVNVNTVMRSYDNLQSLQVLYNKRGIGYFVAADAKNGIRVRRKAQFMSEELPQLFKTMLTLDISMDEVVKLYNRKSKESPQSN